MCKNISCATVLFLLICGSTFAQSDRKANAVMFKTGFIVPDNNLEEFISSPDFSNAELFNSTYYRLVQFNSVPNSSQREQLKSAGIQLLDYIPSKAYYAAIDRSADLNVLRNYNVKSVIKIEHAFKLNKNLVNAPYPQHAMRGSYKIELVLRAHKNLSTYQFRHALSVAGYESSAHYAINNTCVVVVNTNQIQDIASLPFISYLEPVAPLPTPDDLEGRSVHRSAAINTQSSIGRHYDGMGVSIALADDGEVGPHIDFTGRISNDDPDLNGPGGGHGDMTAGIAVGAGNLNPRNSGMASGAFIHIYSINGYDHVRGADTSQLGYTITSTSYSQGCNEYTNDTELGDQMIHDNPHLIHVFSAGNNANGNCGYGVTGYGNITGGFKQGKNVIATGNLTYLDSRVNSSSRGPAEDGRVKPDLCANGGSQTSTDDFNTYQTGGGTSAACPGIAGTLAQLTQAYKELNGNALPETALLKACLQNTAEDLGRPGPDYDFGYGRINALRAVQILENVDYVSDTIDQGGSDLYTITVPAGMAELRVLIHWSDPGGNPNSATALVNDLNMQVSDLITSYDPWILDPTATLASIQTNAWRGVDSLNNTEQVTLDNPAAGVYTVTIDGHNVADGPQRYWLVWEMRSADPVVTFPVGGEGFWPNQVEVIRWDATKDGSTFSLEYSDDDGSTWNMISSTIPANQLYFEWNVPSIQTGDALVRVTRNGLTGVSPDKFSIVEIPTGLSLEWACPDSIGLTWDSVPGVDGYEISWLGAMYMDSIGYSTTNNITIYNTSPIQSYWFSVRSIGPGDIRGERAIAVNIVPGVLNCPIAVDAAVFDIVSPQPGQVQDCQSVTAGIEIEIINIGQNTLDTIPVYYSVNGGTPVMENYIGPIAPQGFDNYVFANSPTFTGGNTYDIDIWVGHVADGNRYNDSANVKLAIINSTNAGPYLLEDFESSGLCNTGSDCELTSCAIQNGWVNETNIDFDDIDFRVVNGFTPSNGTGPNSGNDHNPGTSTGHYVYTEASAGCEGQQANLVSPCVDLTGTSSPNLVFWYS
ncbi:MAG: S8 family serine peptidase, partial [Bacteroidia bacterium]|nr:S8 family serine peptidase [Bacteroidia bacterium]